MGLGRRAMVYLGLAEEDEEYLDDEYDEPEEPRERAVRRLDARDARDEPVTPVRRPGPVEQRPLAAAVGAPVPARRPAVVEEAAPYRITTLQPRSYNDARQIGEEFREATPVIMNLTEMDDDDAKRLVDFAAGLIFGLHGKIEKVTNKVFLLSPNNVVVTETDRQRIREGGFYNQS